MIKIVESVQHVSHGFDLKGMNCDANARITIHLFKKEYT